MQAVSGFRITETLHLGWRVAVYRAVRLADGAPVVVKCLKRPRDGSTDWARFRREYEIGRRVGGPGIVPILALDATRQGMALVMADSGGVSVAVARQSRPPDLIETLRIGAAAAAALGTIHRAHVIHKDVNPANIVWNRAAGTVELIDFGIAAELARETSPAETDQLEGTLAYIAPEQTGRMNRSLDWRSDFYSLGATLYDLLTGRPPFEGDDALAVIHGHIARAPAPPHQLDGAIPPMVSAIVLKLLAKDPERRYQSAPGILADLEACLEALTVSDTVPVFTAGCRDVSPRFHIPEKLYGREADSQRLLGCFEAVAAGATRLLMVEGPAGIGKSALVQEVRKPLTARRGTFIHGKYDQFRRNLPYSAVVQAFGLLARHLLSEPEEVLVRQRQALLAAVGRTGAVITELIPEFGPVLGPQPPVPPLPPAGSEFRFQITFQNLVVALARPERPLVIFLDDLQWADRSSLILLAKLVCDPEMRHLMIIGAYRSEEVVGHHPLTRAVDGIVEAGQPVDTITIGPLAPADVRTLVAEATRRDDDEVDDGEVDRLAKLCRDKTEGNPFFLIQFLQSLHDDGLISLNHATGLWTWDADAIGRRDSTANVVDLMIGKIRRLDGATGRVLSLAACVGNSFDLGTLAVAAQGGIERLAGALWPALLEGLILPLDGNYRYLSPDHSPNLSPDAGGGPTDRGLVAGLSVRYRFLHDRVQQAAYSLIPEQDRAAAHLRIGRLLLAETLEAEREDRLFAIVDQLNQGGPLIADPAERHAVAMLNREAAARAHASAAFEAALAYARAGIGLLGAGAWCDDYELAFALHLEAAEAAAMIDDYALMESLAGAALDRARDAIDAARVQMVRLTASAARGDPAAATAIGLQALAALGVTLPRAPGAGRLWLEVWRGRLALVTARLRPATGPDSAWRTTVARVLMAMVTVAIISRSDLLVPIAVRLLEVALPARDTGISSSAYLAWALISAVRGDCADAVHYSRCALDLVDHEGQRTRAVRVVVMANYCGQHWAVPAAVLRQRYLDLYHAALAAGDREYAVYGLAFGLRSGWQTGAGLAQFKAELDESARALSRLGTTPYTAYVAGLRQAVKNLESGGAAPERLEGDFLSEAAAFPELRATHFMIIVVNLLTVKLLLALVFGRLTEARALAAEVAADQHFLHGYSTHPVAVFLGGLTAAAGPFATGAARRAAARQVARAVHGLRRCAAAGPVNHRHRWLLLRAELMRLTGKVAAAWPLYEQAVTAAAETGHLHEEALANECAAAFSVEHGYATQERAYRAQARDAYRRWGAWAKVRELERRHPELAAVSAGPANGTTTITTTASTGHFGTGALDLAALLKAAQAISGEIRREALLETLLRVVLHTAGAERGQLLLVQPGATLVLVAEGDAGRDRFALLPGLAPNTPDAEGRPRLPASVIAFAARSREAVVLADVVVDARFADDPYVRARRPRSVLCLPLVRRNELVGVLYLENNLTTNAFVDDRLEAPRLLAAQIAISLENARLYDNLHDFNRALEAQVAERTRALQVALDGEREAHEQLRSAQKQLVQVEKLASLAQMVAGIAHEINTPVGIALTSVSMLVDRTDSIRQHFVNGRLRRSDAESYFGLVDESSRLILANVHRACKLVQSFKQVAVDRVSEQRRTFDLAVWLEDLVISLGPAWRGAGHRFDTSCPAGIEIDGYADVLAQVVTNLVMNSLAHGYEPGRKGRLAVTVSMPDDDSVELVYTDDGKGIPAANRSKVFDPFFTTRRNAGNTGLGLHIVFTLVNARLGGQILLDETTTAGTRWVVSFPRLMPATPAQPAEDQSPKNQQPARDQAADREAAD